ncbi:MAG: protein kinase [Holophagales bacterium]|nr:protein kinase [Holophagales bacterium]
MKLAAGRRLGPYEILGPIGAGGMGEVYRARDARLDRTIAVKVLPAELAVDEVYRQRFEREARAASALNHPHIAHVYDVGVDEGTHFIAMEYVEGQNLRELLSRGPLDVDRIVDLGQDGLGAGGGPRGGLARKTLESAAALDSRVETEARTQAGLVVGTVPYMSPEQALGKEVDHRTDLFSLGVVLYELAVGRLPFVGDTATQTIDQICHASPEPLSRSRSDVPAELERIVRKCLEKERDSRYATARDLLVDLRNLQRDRASGAGVRTAPVQQKGRRLLLVGAAVLVAAVAVVAGALYGKARQGASIGSVAVLPFENATGDPANDYLSDGISENLINKLSSLPGLRVISRRSAFAFKGQKLSPAEIGAKLGVDALLLGSLAQRGASLAITAELVRVRDETQLWGEKYARSADDVLEVEGEIATTIARTLRRQLSGEEAERLARAETDDPEAYRLYLRARSFLVGNQQEMDKSIDLFQQAVAKAPEYALAHAGLAEAHTRQAFLRGSGREEPLQKARAAVERALELDPDLPEVHAALGLVRFYFEWDWAGAEAEFRRAIELNPGSRVGQEEYGWFLTALGRLDEGLAHSQEAARLDPLSVGPVHDIAINYMVRGELEQAAATFRRAIDIDPNWTWGYVKLGRTLAMQRKCPEAMAQAEVAERRIADGGAPLSRAWLGATYAICGEATRARQKLDELHALSKERYVDPSTYADIHASLGEIDEALRCYEKAWEDRTPNMAYASIASRINPRLAGNPRIEAIVRRMSFPEPKR